MHIHLPSNIVLYNRLQWVGPCKKLNSPSILVCVVCKWTVLVLFVSVADCSCLHVTSEVSELIHVWGVWTDPHLRCLNWSTSEVSELNRWLTDCLASPWLLLKDIDGGRVSARLSGRRAMLTPTASQSSTASLYRGTGSWKTRTPCTGLCPTGRRSWPWSRGVYHVPPRRKRRRSGARTSCCIQARPMIHGKKQRLLKPLRQSRTILARAAMTFTPLTMKLRTRTRTGRGRS